MLALDKILYDTGTRAGNQCYAPAMNASGGLAYICVDEGRRESLVYRAAPDAPKVVLAENTYIFDPHFAGDWLVWSEKQGGRWPLRAVNTADPRPDAIVEPVAVSGRPRAFASWPTQDGSLLAWEERQGKRTRVRMSRISGDRWDVPVDVTAGIFNAYDPAVCTDDAGMIYVSYCTFMRGDYRIFIQQFVAGGQTLGEPLLVSSSNSCCFYPSLYPSSEGGVWFSFTCFSGSATGGPFVQHLRFRAQKGMFGNPGRPFVGLLQSGRLFSPRMMPGAQGQVAEMAVPVRDAVGHTQVLEDSGYNLHLLMRRTSNSAPVEFTRRSDTMKRTKNAGERRPQQIHPDISIATLGDVQWSEPVCLLANGHIERVLSWNLGNDHLKVAFTDDARSTGWNMNGEWFEHEAEVGVGMMEVSLEPQPRRPYEMYPFRSVPRTPPGMEDPVLQAEEWNGFRAVTGQTHTHSNLSVCIRIADRDPHINYRFMQDVQRSDFGGVTDHAYNMWLMEMAYVRKLAEYYYFPGQFVAIPAYEWTGSTDVSHEGGPFGHVNPLYLEEDDGLQFYTPVDPTCAGGSLPRLWETYRGRKIVTPPHHPADHMHYFNWSFFDEQFVPVIELFQDGRGSSEQPFAPGVTNCLHQETGHWALPYLLEGRRFGFIASADHAGIARAGLWVKELTRSGLYEAFMAKRTFGVTALSMQVMLICNDIPMGGSVEAEELRFRIEAQAPEPFAELQVVRDGVTVDSIEVQTCMIDHSWNAQRERRGEFWYVRLILDNGEMAWSSPIWID